MLAINQLYNQKFKKFLCYHQVQDSIICKYDLSNYKRSKFDPTSRNCNLYTPIACIKTTNQDLIWDDFEQFYALITSSQQVETYAFQTYPCHTSLRVGQNTKNSSLYFLQCQITHPQHVGSWDKRIQIMMINVFCRRQSG